MQKINVENWANKEIELLNKDNKNLIFENEYNFRNNKVLELYDDILRSIVDITQLECLIKLLLDKPLTSINENDEFYHNTNNCNGSDNCKRDNKLVRIKRDNNFEYIYDYKIKYHINGDINPYINSKINKLIRKYFPVKFPFNPDIIHVYIESIYFNNNYLWKIILISLDNQNEVFKPLNICYKNNEEISENLYEMLHTA